MAGLSQPTQAHQSWCYGHAQSLAVDFSRPSAQITNSQQGTFQLYQADIYPAMNKPTQAPDSLEIAQRTMSPLCSQAQCSPEPRQEWGEAKKQSWRFSISSCKSQRSCRCNQSYFFPYVSPVCLAKNKWAGLIKPKLY